MFVRLSGVVSAGTDQASLRAAPGAVAQGAMAALATAAGRLLSLEQLAEAIWDDPPASWRNALHVAISRLLDALGRDCSACADGGPGASPG